MRTIPDVMGLEKTIKACPGRGQGPTLAAQSLFLHRISVVRVYLSIAATTQGPAGQDPHQFLSLIPVSLSKYF